ncbi:hypothetical protein GW916_00005 [bacterium]|nr:hypothetical protein [bacterium]
MLGQLQLSILPGQIQNPLPLKQQHLYEQTYSHWKQIWTEVFQKAGGLSCLDPHNFLRQSIICVLHKEGEVAAICTGTIFDLSSQIWNDHHYLKPFPESTMQQLRNTGHNHVMSGEYLSVSRNFRRAFSRISLAEIMIGLVLKCYESLELDAIFNTTVKEVKTDKMCKKFGFQEIGSYQKYGLNCALLMNNFSTLSGHPDPETQALIQQLFASASNFTTFHQFNNHRTLKAA